MAVLAGDIGGTKTLLQLAEHSSDGFVVLYEKRYDSRARATFLEVALDFINEAFLITNQRATSACFGVAGPVTARTAFTTNLPWTLDADDLQIKLGIEKVRLINDFQAAGYGIAELKEQDTVTLQVGNAIPQATQVIIGAGTGLGHAFLVWQGEYYEVVASEGGHADFAATNDLQIEFLKYLQTRYQWAHWESALSGPGLVNIFDFFVEVKHVQPSAEILAALSTGDKAAVISEFAINNKDKVAEQVLDLFIQIYGAQTGNFALLGMATAGVYVAGGIAPKIINKLSDGSFIRAFLDKDLRYQATLKAMPVKVVVHDNVGILGAVLAASRL